MIQHGCCFNYFQTIYSKFEKSNPNCVIICQRTLETSSMFAWKIYIFLFQFCWKAISFLGLPEEIVSEVLKSSLIKWFFSWGLVRNSSIRKELEFVIFYLNRAYFYFKFNEFWTWGFANWLTLPDFPFRLRIFSSVKHVSYIYIQISIKINLMSCHFFILELELCYFTNKVHSYSMTMKFVYGRVCIVNIVFPWIQFHVNRIDTSQLRISAIKRFYSQSSLVCFLWKYGSHNIWIFFLIILIEKLLLF